jgi:type I restriction enzyme, S subunit
VIRPAMITLGEVMVSKAGSVDPSKFQDEVFDLYSIPAFDKGAPEVVVGAQIGSAKQIVEPGDVLLSKIVPHIRRSWVVGANRGRRLIGSGEWIVFRDERVHPEYMRHVLVGDPFHIQFMQTVSGVGGSLLRARPAHVAKIAVPLPALAEQRRIAEILDKANALRVRRREILAQFETLSRSIFLDMFGDAATNAKGFPQVPLGDLIKLKSGEFLPATDMAESGTYPVLGGNGINGRHDQYMFEEPQIVIGRVGVYCGCVHVSPPRCWVTDNALYVSERSEELMFEYLVHALIHARLNQYASQSGQALVSGSRIYPVRILVPPKKLQQTFAGQLSATLNVKVQLEASRTAFDVLFGSLQHRAFRGGL